MILAVTTACTPKQEMPPELYEVVSHDATTGEWRIVQINNEQHKRVEITVTCDFYTSGDNKPVTGPESCDLVTGQTLIPNRLGTRPGDFLDVWQLANRLVITQGTGPQRVSQQFNVRSAKVIQQ
jgi:hypothetical protein